MIIDGIIFLLTITIVRVNSFQIHQDMTPEEVQNVFHTIHENVPVYEVIPIKYINLTNAGEKFMFTPMVVEFEAFNLDIKLYLNPTDGMLIGKNTLFYTATSDPNSPENVRYNLIKDIPTKYGVFQDVDNQAAVLMHPTPTGSWVLDGTVGPGLVIRSLPERVRRDVLFEKNTKYQRYCNKKNDSTNDFVNIHHHIVYKIPRKEGYNHQDFNITIPEGLLNKSRRKREVPDIIYPQILSVIDYNEFLMIGKDIEGAWRYALSFWNGVDLRYRLLLNPKIRINIAAVVIGMDPLAIPYLEKHRVDAASLDADIALADMAEYFYRETRFPIESYDIVIALTQLDMCNMEDYGFCDTSTLGYAFVAGACNRDNVKKRTEAVGIVEDNGGYSGIIPTAHELGHLLGARHDGNEKVAKECPPWEGYIMTSGLTLSERGFGWSECTIKAFYKFLSEKRSHCLRNAPLRDSKTSRILPGTTMSLDDQCEKAFGTKACLINVNVCTRLECQIPGSNNKCAAKSPAAEGSRCGDGLICLNGKCVLDGFSLYPTKSHLTVSQSRWKY